MESEIGKAEDLRGKVFGRFTVLQRDLSRKNKTFWLCRCSCGIQKSVYSAHLKSGHSKSCGCLKKESCLKQIPKMRQINIQFEPKIASARSVWQRVYSDGNLTFDEFYEITQLNCHYCNEPPNNFFSKRKANNCKNKLLIDEDTFIYNGLDRLDSSKNHSKNNVVPCCKWCNYAKRERSKDEFLEWVRKVYHNTINF